MYKRLIAAALIGLPFAIGGIVYGTTPKVGSKAEPGFICPVTGEDLPCPMCCPLGK